MEVATRVGDAHSKQLFRSGFCFLSYIHMERRLANQIVCHKLAIEVHLGAHPDRLEVNKMAFVRLVSRNRNLAIPPAYSLEIFRTGIVRSSKILLYRTRHFDGNSIGVIIQNLPTACGFIHRQQ